MDHLTDEQWGEVVKKALRKRDGWYPVIGELEAYAEEVLPPAPALPMLPPARTLEQREADREVAKRGLILVKEQLKAHGIDLDGVGEIK